MNRINVYVHWGTGWADIGRVKQSIFFSIPWYWNTCTVIRHRKHSTAQCNTSTLAVAKHSGTHALNCIRNIIVILCIFCNCSATLFVREQDQRVRAPGSGIGGYRTGQTVYIFLDLRILKCSHCNTSQETQSQRNRRERTSIEKRITLCPEREYASTFIGTCIAALA